MTKTEVLNAIINGAEITNEMREFAQHELELIANKNSKRAEKEKAKRAEVDEPLMAQLTEFLQGKSAVASEIGVALEISTQKATHIAKRLVDSGVAKSTDVKVKGGRTCKSYSLV